MMPKRSHVITFPPEILARAQGVELLFLDVDGVLTDGGLYFSQDGETLKRFHSLDGQGIVFLQQAGVVLVVISGRDSPALRTRLKALGMVHVYLGVEDKRSVAEQVLANLGLTWEQTAGMGDDWPDLPVMHACRLAVSPASAHVQVRAMAHYVTQAAGGQGAVRECCDLLLQARGCYESLLASYTCQV
jgi:3-deoxy-D-manno-octulosonate 8-phosphate phosphatase (KDO 8-P phosphatase)